MKCSDTIDTLYKYANGEFAYGAPESKPMGYVGGGAAIGGIIGASKGAKKFMPKGTGVKAFGKATLKTPLKVGARLGKAGLIGAGIGALGGAALKGFQGNAEKIASLSDIAEAALKKSQETFQPDIECAVCGYAGRPDNYGKCPECGAIGGEYPDDPEGAFPIYTPYTGQPKDGISVREMAEQESRSRMW